MKFKLSTLIPVLLCLLSCAKQEDLNQSPPINTYEQLISGFSDPSPEYRPAPFWVWNKDVSRSDIDRTLREYKEAGFGGVFLHPRYGLITEYLSPEWFELVKYSVDAAKKLDLGLWIYDENSYPTGFAGGHVNEQMPESFSQGVRLVPKVMSTLSIDKNQRIKYVFKKVDDKWQNITANASAETGSEGEFMVLGLENYERSAWYAGFSYVDLLVKGVTEKFIEITFPGYKKSVGAEFGKTVVGIFSDEPHTSPDVAGTIRWTPDLASGFRELQGYDLEPNMVSLLEETGNWMKIRHDYYATILDMFIRRWSIPMSSYCEDNDLLWTGHYWDHAWPVPSEGPDNMAMYAYHHLPAIDLLYNSQEVRPDQFGNIRVVKELSSAVNQFGRERALCEMYGGSGWEFRFEQMKRNGDWAYALGVNLLNQHLSYMSLLGDRKFDYPPSFGPYAPYWKQYHYQNDYFGRLSVALSSGKQKNRILILEPTTTAWMYYSPDTTILNKRFKEINPSFRRMLSLLEQNQIEYDLGSEHILSDYGKISGKTFQVNKCSYDLVIIPDVMDNIEKTTYTLLKKYVSNGGRVLQIGEGVKYIAAEPSDKLSELVSGKTWIKSPLINREIIDTLLSDPDFQVNISRAGQLFHHRRKMQDGELIFFSNFSPDSISVAEVTITGASVEELSPETGKELQIVYTTSGDKITFPVKLSPSGSFMVYVFKDKVVKAATADKNEVQKPVSGSETEISRTGPNILNLDYLKLKIGDNPEKEMYFKHASDSVYRYFGFADGNPWFKSSQFRTEIRDKDKNYKKGDRFEVSYNFEIGEGVSHKGMKLVVERPWLYVVTLNGVNIQPEKSDYWLDPDFCIFDVEEQVKKGNNTVRLVADPFSIYCETEPVYILGNFGLEPVRNGWKIVKPEHLSFGSWRSQGLPFYGQSVKYSKTFDIQKSGIFGILLPGWFGTVAAVNINGIEVGIIDKIPYSIKTELNKGENTIEVIIIGSLKNTLGPHHAIYPEGVGGRPANFIKAPDEQPEGKAYSLIDYGLMQDFEVYELE